MFACGEASDVSCPENAAAVRAANDGDVGLVLQGSLKDGILRVTQVVVNSAAAASCAVFPGDELVSIDGLSTKDMTAAHAQSSLSGKPGTMVVLEVREATKAGAATAKQAQTLALQRRLQGVELTPRLRGSLSEQLESVTFSLPDYPIFNSDMTDEQDVLDYVSRRHVQYIARLRELVAIPSVSLEARQGRSQRRNEAQRSMMTWLTAWLKHLGASHIHQTDSTDVHPRVSAESTEEEAMWPLLVASFEASPSHPANSATAASPSSFKRPANSGASKRVLVHVHYDVLPAYLEDGWSHDPFLLLQHHHTLSGRVGGKADVCAWLLAIEAFKETRCALPGPQFSCVTSTKIQKLTLLRSWQSQST